MAQTKSRNDIFYGLQMLLHCAIFSATCLATPLQWKLPKKIIALSHCAIFSSNLQHFELRKAGTRSTSCASCSFCSLAAILNSYPELLRAISENAHALTANVTRKLQQKLLEGWNTVQWRWKLLQCVAKSRLEFYFVQRSVQQKKLRDDPCYTVQFTSNLCRKRRCETSCWENCAV